MFLHAFVNSGEDTVPRRLLTYLLQGLVTKYARRVSNLGGSVGYATLLGIQKSLAGYDAIRSLLSSPDQLI